MDSAFLRVEGLKKVFPGPKGKPLKEPKAAAAPSEKRWAGSQWNDATPAQRRDVLAVR